MNLQNPDLDLGLKFSATPLVLDGKPLDYQSFNLETSGQLTLVVGNPPEQVPFYVQLRPQDHHIPDLNYLNRSVYSIEVSNIIANAKGGDLLIITPTSPWIGKLKEYF